MIDYRAVCNRNNVTAWLARCGHLIVVFVIALRQLVRDTLMAFYAGLTGVVFDNLFHLLCRAPFLFVEIHKLVSVAIAALA